MVVIIPPELASGGGIMGDLIRNYNWAETDVGPMDKWPTHFVSNVATMLYSKFPTILYWGPNLEIVYNDAYIPIFGARHPYALGKQGSVMWAEVWGVISPFFQQALEGGSGWKEDSPFFLTRNKYLEEAYISFSLSPIHKEDGTVGGVFNPVFETTKRVLSTRRLQALRELGSSLSQLEDVGTVLQVYTDVLESNRADIPFSALYLLENDKLILKSTSAISKGHSATPLEITLDVNDPCVWPAYEVMKSCTHTVVENLEEKLGHLPSTWPESSQTAVVIPILGRDNRIVGMLVLGVNIRRTLDDDYMGFLELVAGQVSKALGTVKEFEEQKKRAEMLVELDRAKTIFFSNVSHEFRTPLTLIMGPLEECLTDTVTPLPAVHHKRLSIVQRSTMRLMRIVNSILDYSRLEAGRMQAKFEPVDLTTLTKDLVSVFRAAFQKARIELKVVTTPLKERVYVDVDMWEKIVYNLMSNAIKYTLQGSVQISLTSLENSVVFSVSDTGIGISEKEAPKIFVRFHRVENSEGRSHEGTGIGLSLTQELVKLHGGQITLESKLGVGSTFSVKIPYGCSHLPPKQVKKIEKDKVEISELGHKFAEEAMKWNTPQINGQGKHLFDKHPKIEPQIGGLDLLDPPQLQEGKILLVDDNADMRDYVCSLLERNWECVAVCDGLEALTTLQQKPAYFDLVLSDIMMPRMDGFQLIAAMKADKNMKHLPVILLSARAGEEAAVEGLHAGADDYLVKPFAAKELLARVAIHLELSRFRCKLERLVQERTAELEELNAALQQTLKERQKAEHALRVSEQQYYTLAKVSPVALIHTDALGNAFYINDRWSDISGIPKEQGLGSGWLDMVYPEDVASISKALRATMEGNPLELEFRYENKSMTPPAIRWVLGQHLPDIDENGKVQGFVCTLTDITERKMLEKARYEEQRRRASEAEENKAKQAQFVDMICHEIRNPLNGILNNIDIMKFSAEKVNPIVIEIKDVCPKGEEVYEKMVLDLECLGAIEQCAAHQLVITDDVIRASKLEANKVLLNRVNFNPYSLFDSVANLYSPELAAKQIAMDLKIELPPTMVLNSDPNRISQVMMNLLSNAIKFTEKAPKRQISVYCHIVTPQQQHGDVIIETEVSDTGLGMNDEEQKVIFKRFAQASSKTFHDYGGTGLGLYISKMLVDLLGGEISVTSKKTQGATFRFTIRCGKATENSDIKEETPAVSQVENLQKVKSSHILVVEDNLVNQKVLIRQLTMSGYLCDVANNGQEAVDKFENGNYDLIFMDVEMPVKNGLEATKEIREKEKALAKLNPVIIIGLSGNARSVYSEMGTGAGMNDYVVKPYKREVLQKKIEYYLQNRSSTP